MHCTRNARSMREAGSITEGPVGGAGRAAAVDSGATGSGSGVAGMAGLLSHSPSFAAVTPSRSATIS